MYVISGQQYLMMVTWIRAVQAHYLVHEPGGLFRIPPHAAVGVQLAPLGIGCCWGLLVSLSSGWAMALITHVGVLSGLLLTVSYL